MSDSATATQTGYQPAMIEIPPLYAWPPKPLAALRWLLFGMLFPWGMVYLAYSNTPTPIDKLFGSWHDGTAESLMAKRRHRGVQMA
tara:strand:- start:379 stop:636 length:258 start_codon:yes stop_codon:yes gene_type:complete